MNSALSLVLLAFPCSQAASVTTLSGNNVFEGGFLGLDNIGVFDRSAPLPTGGYLDQAGRTMWMALYFQNMLEIAEELATYRPVYSDMCVKFLEHFL